MDSATSTAFLTRMQQRADNMGGTIKFSEQVDKIHTSTLRNLIKYAITQRYGSYGGMHPTVRTGLKGRDRQQMLGSTRSILDLYLLAKHYLPGTTIFQVRDVLQEFQDEGKLYANFCFTFGRMMFRYETSYYNSTLEKNYGIVKKLKVPQNFGKK